MTKNRARVSKYEWDKWSGPLEEGQAWKVTRFLDYDCESASFATQVYQEAARRNLKATVTVFPSYVLFRFYKESDFWKPNLRAFPAVKDLRKQEERGHLR